MQYNISIFVHGQLPHASITFTMWSTNRRPVITNAVPVSALKNLPILENIRFEASEHMNPSKLRTYAKKKQAVIV
jgi:hypothetical protein